MGLDSLRERIEHELDQKVLRYIAKGGKQPILKFPASFVGISDEERTRIRKRNSAFKNYFFRGSYPATDRIDPHLGFEMAHDLNRNPKIDCRLSIKNAGPETIERIENQALDHFKGLVRIIQKVYKIRDRPSQIAGYKKQLNNRQNCSPEDLELYLPAVTLFSAYAERKPEGFDQLVHNLEPKEFADLIEGGVSLSSFDKRKDRTFQIMARKFLERLNECLPRLEYEVKHTVFVEGPSYNKFISQFERLCREIVVDVDPEGANELIQDFKTDYDRLLIARLNYSAEKVMLNDVDCCITGPYGDHRAATMLNWLDSSVFTWEMYSCAEILNEQVPRREPFGLAIFVRATGNHFSKKKEEYLVFEGFPANRKKYSRIGKLDSVCEDVLSFDRDESFVFPDSCMSLPEREFSLPELVYVLGLITARELKIPKLFINTSHSPQTQQSVDDSVLKMLEITGNKNNWDYGRKCLIKDPLTNGPMECISLGDKKFQYTHFLQKPRLDASLVTKLCKEDETRYRKVIETNCFNEWSGESVFDTWYWWNVFIGNTYDNWPKALKEAHPYAARVSKRAKWRRKNDMHPESYWNLGIGYCKGFEVDVAKECERLGIS